MAGRTTIIRVVWITLACLIALAAGIALAYWQWTRYESIDGTLQNLGYVLQWPLFGIFPAVMVWRIYRVAQRERARRAEEAPATGEQPAAGPAPEAEPAPSKMAYVPPTVADQPTGDDPVLARYNDLLAQLSAEDEQRTTPAATNRGSA